MKLKFKKNVFNRMLLIPLLMLFNARNLTAAPVVLVSIEPLALLVREICDVHCDVLTLVPKGTSEHHWQPSPKDTIKSKGAIAAIGVGLMFDDQWFKRLKVDDKSTLLLGMKLSPMKWWSDDLSDQSLPHQDHLKSKHDESHSGGVDPHIWIDAKRMSRAAIIIAEFLAPMIKGAERSILDRGRLISDRIDRMQASVESQRKFWKTRPVLMTHDVAGYFGRRFDLPILTFSSGSTGHEISAKMLSNGATKMQAVKVAAILVESSGGVVQNLAKELKAQVVIIDFSATKNYVNWDEWYMSIVQAWSEVLR